ncbi:MAG: hypothetical protein C4295_00010 [Candidatus Fervidibacterota bacterium]
MRQEIPTWVAVVVIVVIIAIAAIVIWRGTGVRKEELPPEKMPGAMMQKYGAPGPMVPRPGQPTQPAPTPPAGR